jgi:uncharacterized membrane protein YphA (DoxX/SURF4 family)
MPILVILRILLGLCFIFTGGSKLLAPYQNFLYVVQSYQVFSPPIEQLAARVVPWIEFFLGLFLVLGLWLKNVLIGFLILISGFVVMLSQAIIRGLPVDHCGCFGSWLSVPIRTMVMIDSTFWLITLLMLLRLKQTSAFSLDNNLS